MARLTILDGAMGTMIQAAGLRLGERPEIFALDHPERIESIQRMYIEAGSDILYANTFGANRHKLEGTGHSCAELIKANVAIARRAAGTRAKVALDVGPIGELMAPLGTLSFDEAYDIFAEMVKAGVEAGVDLVIFETFTDLYEVKAAVLAAKENSSLPVWVTMSFELGGRTFTGTTVECMASTLDGLDVDAMGVNCSLGPKEILPLIRRMSEWTDRPLIVKPNAGLPDPETGNYLITPEVFAEEMRGFLELGVDIVGGCCGTTPAFIRALAALPREIGTRTKATRRGVCSASHMSEFSGVKVIGERINPTGKKRFQQALREHDMNYIMERAIEQAEAGADILDINVGVPGLDEKALMKEVVQAVQSVVDLPLQIDSSNTEAIEVGLRYTNGRAIVNSVNAEDEKLDAVLPLARKYGAAVVGLAIGKNLPRSAEERFSFAKRIMERALESGIEKEDILIDCLTLTISAQQEQAAETLRAVRRVHEELGLHNVLGVSNISFGLPERSHITTSFLTQAMLCGLDFPIVNPNSTAIMDAVAAFKALSGEDRSCTDYIERFVNAEKKEMAPKVSGDMTIAEAVLKGLAQETENLTRAKLETMSELDVINRELIPALDQVGLRYEKQEIFLPQLINAANAACKGFDLIKKRIAGRSGESISKGKIIIATVEGDIHDIGKNIVRVVLENYGYQVIDLGKDVPVSTVVERMIKEDVHLVGLSALMTTTVESMKRTLEAIRRTGHECRIFVGGAVLTEKYAMEIGADYYSKDAKAAVDIARKVLG